MHRCLAVQAADASIILLHARRDVHAARHVDQSNRVRTVTKTVATQLAADIKQSRLI